MIDLHTHIIPTVDDGAKNIEQSLLLIDMLIAQSVDEIVLTPHFYPEIMPMEKFLKRRNAAYSELLLTMKDRNIKFHLASETQYSHLLLNYSNLKSICIENTSYLLLELPYTSTFESKMFTDIDRIVNEYGITPIIAHIDRYIPVHKDPRVIEKLRDIGCLIQLNCDSLINLFSRGFAKKLLKRNVVDVLGTDCHNTTTRPPNMSKALQVILAQFGEDYIGTLQNNAKYIVAEQKDELVTFKSML